MSELQAAIIGYGFVGKAHAEALCRLRIPIRGVLEKSPEISDSALRDLGCDRAYTEIDELVADKQVQVVHICTPNYLHFEFAQAALSGGKHVICEKPLGMNSQETNQLVELVNSKGLVGSVSYNGRYYPLCQQARALIQKGEIGEPMLIHGSYLQDWLFYPSDWNWRLDPELGGSQRAIADIGIHWLDLAVWMTGLPVIEVSADIATMIPVRHKPIEEVATFDSKFETSLQYEEKEIRTEDYASILLRFDGGARGVLTVSQVSAGRKDRLWIEVDGMDGSIAWNSEKPNQLWLGRRDQPNKLLIKDPMLMETSIRSYAGYPGGHAEGYPDTFVQFFKEVYGYISVGEFDAQRNFPTFDTGHEGVHLCEGIAQSIEQGGWAQIKPS
jgi:predicted dehydrogenase